MNKKQITLREFTLVGISIRTNNNKAQQQGDIAQLWSTLISNNIVNKIENRISDDIYCVYTEYESDFNGEYTCFLGCQVSSLDKLDKELKTLKIEAQHYLEFVSEGELPTCVLQTWNHIWNEKYTRAYKADFDIYGEDAKNASDAKVTTYLSII